MGGGAWHNSVPAAVAAASQPLRRVTLAVEPCQCRCGPVTVLELVTRLNTLIV